MKRFSVSTAVLLAACLTPAAWSQSGRLALAAKAGTLGLGGELSVNVLTDLNCRFGATVLDVGFDSQVADIDYDFDLDLQAFPLMVDWYPFDDAFHISAGIILNETDIGLDAEYAGLVTIGNVTYPGNQVGILSGDLSFDPVAPYIGIGWGNAFGSRRRWGFMTDFGVAFIGSPDVSLTATGPLAVAADPAFLANLAREQEDLEDDLSDFKVYPVLSVSLFLRF